MSYQITTMRGGHIITKTFPMDGVAFLQANLDGEQINKFGSILDDTFAQLGWPSTIAPPPAGDDDEAPPPRKRKRKRRNRKRAHQWRKPDVIN